MKVLERLSRTRLHILAPSCPLLWLSHCYSKVVWIKCVIWTFIHSRPLGHNFKKPCKFYMESKERAPQQELSLQKRNSCQTHGSSPLRMTRSPYPSRGAASTTMRATSHLGSTIPASQRWMPAWLTKIKETIEQYSNNSCSHRALLLLQRETNSKYSLNARISSHLDLNIMGQTRFLNTILVTSGRSPST